MRYRVVRARQRTITALDGAGDQGLWLVPNRRLSGAVPPPAYDLLIGVGNDGFEWGWRENSYGSITPNPYQLFGTVYLARNFVELGSGWVIWRGQTGGIPIGRRYWVEFDGQAELPFINGSSSEWKAYSRAMVNYFVSKNGQTIEVNERFDTAPVVASYVGTITIGANGNFPGWDGGQPIGDMVPNDVQLGVANMSVIRADVGIGTVTITCAKAPGNVNGIRLTIGTNPPVDFPAGGTATSVVDAGLAAYFLASVGLSLAITVALL